MIYNNAYYEGYINTFTMCEFGQGTIEMISTLGEDGYSIGFKQNEIGKSDKTYNTMGDFEPNIVFKFTNIESVDVLIGFLEQAKKELNK
jgi:hypothetical protein